MKSRIEIKSIIAYFIGSVFSKIIVFLLLPLYTKNISTSDFGFYDTTIAIATLFASFLYIDIGSGVMKFVFEKKNSDGVAINSGNIIFLCSTVLYIISASFFIIFLDVKYIWLIVIYGFLTAYLSYASFITRTFKRNVYFALSGGVATIINVAFNLIFILCCNMDYSALYYSSIISTAIQILMLEIRNRTMCFFKKENFNKELFVKLLLYCLPLCVNSIGYWIMTSMNKLFVTYMIGTDANGLYAISAKFTSIIFLVSSCVQLAWQECAYSIDNEMYKDEIGKYYTNATKTYFRFLIVGNLLVIPIINLFFPILIDESYFSSNQYVVFAILGTSLCILNSFMGSIFGSIKKTGVIMISTILGSVVNIGTIIILINLGIGIQSANYAFIAGFMVSIIVRWILLKKYINYNFPIIHLVVLLILSVGLHFIFLQNRFVNIITLVVAFIVSIFILRKDIMDVVNKIHERKGDLNEM